MIENYSMKNMNKFIIIFAFLLAAIPSFLSAQEKKQPAGQKHAPMVYEAFFKKDMQKLDGIFSVYRNGEKYYIEIPANALGRDLVASGRVTQGEFYGQLSAETKLLIFNLGIKNTLEVRQQICTDRAEGDMIKAVEASGMKPVLFSYPITAYGKDRESYIIDITADVTHSGKLFSFPNINYVNKPAADRSGVDSVYIIRNGVKFISQHAQTDIIPGFMHIPPRDKHTTVLVEWSLQLLPERKIIARDADTRVGYSTISYNDYDRNPYGVTKVKQIQRWHLEMKPEDVDRYRRGELVEPVNPIRVYLDRTLSSQSQRNAVTRAVAEWNKCFEAAGFKNTLQIQTGEPEVSVAYHQIVYSLVPGGENQFSQISDPRTGEILSGVIGLSLTDINENGLLALLDIAGYNPSVLKDSLSIAREEYIRYRVANLTGKMLGLIPNIAGSAAFSTAQLRNAAWVREHGISASVTDGSAVNFAAQPGDGISIHDLFSKVSDYDRWAIEWGYRQYPGMDATAEKKALSTLAAQAKDNASLYFAPAGRTGYRVSETDLGQNKLETATLGLQNLERLSKFISKAYVTQMKDDEPWKSYILFIGNVNSLFDKHVKTALDYFGGINIEPIVAGYNEQSWSFLPKVETQKAMEFLNRYLFQGTPEWRNDSIEREVIGNIADVKSTQIIMNICRGLMNPIMLEQLLKAQEIQGNKVYTVNDLFKALDRYVFSNYSSTKTISRYQVLIQYNLVREFVSTYTKLKAKEGYDALSFLLVNKGEELKKQLNRLGKTHSDATSRTYYRGLSIYLNRGLETGTLPSLFNQAGK